MSSEATYKLVKVIWIPVGGVCEGGGTGEGKKSNGIEAR